MNRIRVSVVKYINSLPYVYGIETVNPPLDAEIRYDTPAECYQKLTRGECETGLVPVVALLRDPGLRILGDYGLCCSGPVRSVILVSTCPVSRVSTIYLDYQSKTSVELVRILCREYWKINPVFIPARPGFEEENLPPDAAKLVIGDRAFSFYNKDYFITDLGDTWKNYTGTDFIFAVWAVRKPLPEKFQHKFILALESGTSNIDKVVDNYETELDKQELKNYLEQNIQYKINVSARKGLTLFLNLIGLSYINSR